MTGGSSTKTLSKPSATARTERVSETRLSTTRVTRQKKKKKNSQDDVLLWDSLDLGDPVINRLYVLIGRPL